MGKKLGALILATVAATAYAVVENREIIESNYTISSDKLPDSFVGKKILVLSDLHRKRYGDNFNNLMNSVIAAEPDFIFFTGDLYSRTETDMIPKIALMRRLKSTAPLYYILGNHEIQNMDCADALCYKLESEGVHVLRNAHEKIYCEMDSIDIYGTEIPLKYYKNREGGFRNLPKLTADKLTKMLGKPDKRRFNILLSHTPFPFNAYAEWGADLTFSGHCHGGVIRLPYVGGILSPERKFLPEYTKGIYRKEVDNGAAQMLVTAGLGKFRINNPSEIMLCTLNKQ